MKSWTTRTVVVELWWISRWSVGQLEVNSRWTLGASGGEVEPAAVVFAATEATGRWDLAELIHSKIVTLEGGD